MPFARNLMHWCLGAACLVSPILASAQAADYPNKPIRFIFPWAPGSTINNLTRSLAEGMAARLKQPVVLDTRTGANGIVAAKGLIDAAPDGYTIMVGNEGSFGINTARPGATYDARRDFAPVSHLATTPLFLVVSAASTYQNLAQMVQDAKAHPKKVSFGTIGIGSSSHLAIEKLALATGADLVHVPYKGSPEVLTSIQGGHVTFGYNGGVAAVNTGRVRALAVGSATRYPGAPSIPTVKEQLGVDYDEAAWFGIVAPKGTPEAIVQKLNAVIADTLADPKLREHYSALGFDISLSSPAELGRKIERSVDSSARVIKAAGIDFN